MKTLLLAAGLFAFPLLVTIAACGSDGAQPPGGGGGPPDAGGPDMGSPDGDAGDASPSDKPTSLFDPDHIHEVAITMPAAEWDTLRFEHNDPADVLGGMCLTAPKDTPFVYHHAKMAIDGQTFPDVAIRKKGFLGSQSVSRPSLKVKLDEYAPGTTFFDTSKLTLNNNKQDFAFVRTCLAYELYAKAGVPASRCSFAHLTVNGADLGIYSNVEPIEKDMLARVFPDSSGNLYEGQFSDFRDAWRDTYDKKTNSSDPDRSDLAALSDALALGDGEVLSKVDALLDREAFLTFWAMEALVGSWDGYTNDQNNHYVYHEPKSGKFFFLPWGPDAAFTPDPRGLADTPTSIYAWGAVPNRLYKLPEIRAAYRARALKLLDEVMAKDAVLAELERMRALIAPYADDKEGSFKAEIAAIKAFIEARHDAVTKELDKGPVDWTTGLHGDPCVKVAGTASGTFTTKMGTTALNNPIATGKGTSHVEIDGMTIDTSTLGVASGLYGPSVEIQNVAFLEDGSVRVTVIFVDRTLFAPGKDLPFDWQQVYAVYGKVDLSNNHFTLLGYLDNGALHLDQASFDKNAPVTGSFNATLLTVAPD
ncbi:MAG: CotH kinase family protein [Byssovorax sp.]